MLYRVLIVLACLVLPIIWGVAIHRIFEFLEKKFRGDKPSDNTYPDFQI